MAAAVVGINPTSALDTGFFTVGAVVVAVLSGDVGPACGMGAQVRSPARGGRATLRAGVGRGRGLAKVGRGERQCRNPTYF